MIRLAIKQGMLGESVEHFDLPGDVVVTPRQLVDEFERKLQREVPILVAVDGRLVETDEAADAPVQDGQQIIIMPQTAGELVVAVLVHVLISVIVSVAVNYVASLLAPRPKAAGVAQERGDDSSATYAWDGLKTNYGPGMPIPWVYGRHNLGGNSIWMDTEASRSSSNVAVDDRLRLILSLCQGPVHRFGNIAAASIDNMGGFVGQVPGPTIPTTLSINGNLLAPAEPLPGARVSVRPGTQDQPPLPAPFSGISSTETVDLALRGPAGFQVYTIDDAADLSQIRVVVGFPAGLYAQGPTGQPVLQQAFLSVFWRLPGTSTSGTLIRSTASPGGAFPLHTGGPFTGYHAATFTMNASNVGFPTNVSGPIELFFAYSANTGLAIVSDGVLRDITLTRPHTLRYPGEALLALEVPAGVRFSGGAPQVQVRCDGALVRVWDATDGWSPRCWDVPASPFDFNTHAPGRNPSWCLLDFLLSKWGLGKWLTESDIDLPAFRAWAAFCDQDPNPDDPWGEPQFCVDVVGDQPRPVWEWVLLFCASGRATPVMRDGKISVVYQYRDAHSDGGVTIPANEPVQLITAGNCENVQVNWLSRKRRPTVYNFQFLNEDKAYEQDTYPVEDDEGTLNDPSSVDQDAYIPESVQAYGITRKSQLFREGVWRHRIQRQVRRELVFTTGPWALAAEVGQLIDFQAEFLRPFSADVPMAMQVLAGGTATTTITIDHHLSGTGLQVKVRDPDGKPQARNITSFINSTSPSGRPVSDLTLAVAVTVANGAPCVVGKVDKLTQPYQVVAITLQKDLKREVRCLQWTPDAYDPITKDAFEGLLEAGDVAPGDTDEVVTEATDDDLPPSVYGIRVQTEIDGSHRISWARPGTRTDTWARIYLREAAASQAWLLAGSTELSDLVVRGLRPGQSYTVSVCLENRRSEPVIPDLGDQLTFTAEEFPPFQLPAITNLRATVLDAFVLLEWDELGQRDFDYVEVRSGSNWAAGAILAREKAPRAVLPQLPGGAPLMAAPRSRSGLYGPIVTLANPGWLPPNTAVVLDENDLAPSPAGTHSNTQWNGTDGVIELVAGALSGTYESLAQDLTTQAPYHWRVRVDRQELEDVTVGSLDFQLGSGEARWRQVAGRPASPASPGIDWQTKVQDLAMPIGDLPGTLLVGGHVGEVGSHTQVLVESRFHVGGSWTAYKPHVDRVVVARQMQVRITFNRRALTYRPRVSLLAYGASI